MSGTVAKILVEEGQTVPVGTDLAEVSEGGAGGAAPAPGEAAVPAPAVGEEAAESAPHARCER